MSNQKYLILKKGNVFHSHYAFYNNKYRYMSEVELTRDIIVDYDEEFDPLIAKGIRPKPDQHVKYYKRLLVLQELVKSMPIDKRHTRGKIYMELYEKKDPILLTKQSGYATEGIASCFLYWQPYIIQDKVKNNKNKWYDHYYRLNPNTAFLFSNKHSFYLTEKNPLLEMNDEDRHEIIDEFPEEDEEMDWKYDQYLKIKQSVQNKIKKGVLKISS